VSQRTAWAVVAIRLSLSQLHWHYRCSQLAGLCAEALNWLMKTPLRQYNISRRGIHLLRERAFARTCLFTRRPFWRELVGFYGTGQGLELVEQRRLSKSSKHSGTCAIAHFIPVNLYCFVYIALVLQSWAKLLEISLAATDHLSHT